MINILTIYTVCYTIIIVLLRLQEVAHVSTAKFHSYEATGTSTADAARLAIEIIQTHPEITWTEAYLNGEENRLVVAGVIDDTPCELSVSPVCCGIIDAQTRDTVGVLAETEAFEETDARLRV